MLKTLIAIITLTFSFYANAYGSSSGDAKNFVQPTSSRVVAVIEQSVAPSKKEHTLDDIFIDVTDIDWIGKYVIGRYWQNLNDSQKTTYLQKYKKFLVSSYVPLFKDYNGHRLEIKNSKELGNDQFLVVTEIKPADDQTPSYRVDYRLQFTSGTFKMRDIIAEGVSMIATQRSEFSSILTNSGFESLLAKLDEKSSKN